MICYSKSITFLLWFTGTADRIVTLEDEPFNWVVGDRVVVASSDYDMNHAEEFVIGDCASCTANQVNLQGQLKVASDSIVYLAAVQLPVFASSPLSQPLNCRVKINFVCACCFVDC
jgi:hypothetical protein